MPFESGTFKAAFWETDFLTQHGFDTLATHIKNGQRSCKWLEDYFKQRAKAEDDYAKALLKISKSTINEFGLLRKALEELRTESEAEATLHSSIAAKIQEESLKLEKFKEKQKEERKKNEEIVHKSHKTKADLYRRMQHCKGTYENKFKAAEKAESDANKIKFGPKVKEAEKARKHALQVRSNAIKADEDYKNSVITVEAARQQWIQDHANSCGEFQRMEEERIKFMRNSVWIFSNLGSDLCCRLDDSREKIRLVTEKCDEHADIKEFIAQKSTSINPLLPVEYIPLGSTNSQTGLSTHIDVKPLPQIANGSQAIYEMGDDPSQTYSAIYSYTPTKGDEIELQVGDVIKSIASPESGWLKGLNMRSKATGLLPLNYVELI